MSRIKLLLLSAVFIITLNVLDVLLLGGRYLTSVELLLLAFVGAWCGDKQITERKV